MSDTVFVPGKGEVRLGKKIKSPIPDHIRGKPDRHASFSLYRCKYNRDLILWKDQGTGASGTYNQLMEMLGHKVSRSFGRTEIDPFKPMQTVKPKDFAFVKSYKEKMWLPEDEALWHPYGVLVQALLIYKTILADKLVYVKDRIEHELDSKDSQICIWFYDGIMKMYRINEKSKPKKHLTLGLGESVFGLNVVPEGTEDVVLVGGQKDSISLFSNTGFYGISLNSESADMTPMQFLSIKRKAKRVWSWYDDDEAGRTGTQKLQNSYMIRPLLPIPQLSDSRMQRDPANWFKDMRNQGMKIAERRQRFIDHFQKSKQWDGRTK